jgi:uncharacterized protein (TIGR02611 family)
MKPASSQGFQTRLHRFFRVHDVPPFVRRVIVGVIGGTILLAGIALIFLPGPAFIVIPLGLAILATEFVWARRWLRKTRKLFLEAKKSVSHQGKRHASSNDR